jgi:hypothetical protein
VLLVTGDVMGVPDRMVDVLPLQVCAVSFQVPLHALMATVPAVVPTIRTLYVVPTSDRVPVFDTEMYCGVDGVAEIGNVMTVLDDVTFQAPDVTVRVAEATPPSPAKARCA